MKTAVVLVAAVLLTIGCKPLKPPVVTNLDAGPRLSDLKSDASSMAEELNTQTTKLIEDANGVADLVAQVRAVAPALADKIAALIGDMQNKLAQQQSLVTRERELVNKIASVQAQVDAQATTIQTLQAANAKLTAADRPNTKGYLALGFFLLAAGAFVTVKADRMAGYAMLASGAIYTTAGIFIQPLLDGAPVLVYGLYALIFLVVCYLLWRFAKKQKALVQTVTSQEIANKTTAKFSEPIAQLQTLQLKSGQDQSVSEMVDSIRARIDPDMVRRETDRAVAVSTLPPIVPPSPAVPTLNTLVGAEQGQTTVIPQTVTGPAVGSG